MNSVTIALTFMLQTQYSVAEIGAVTGVWVLNKVNKVAPIQIICMFKTTQEDLYKHNVSPFQTPITKRFSMISPGK